MGKNKVKVKGKGMEIIMIIYFIKIKTNLEKNDIYSNLRTKVKKPTLCISIGFLREKIVGRIDENKNFITIRRSTNTENPLVSIFYGSVYEDKKYRLLEGYYYINPIIVIIFLTIFVLFIPTLLEKISFINMVLILSFLLFLLHSVYRNIKDIRIINEILMEATESKYIINQAIKNKMILFIELLIVICSLIILLYFRL
jgi:hypothetical protein